MRARFTRCGLVILLLVLTGGTPADENRHGVAIAHPGAGPSGTLDGTLVQVRNPGGPDTFHMTVDSVSCSDDQCKIVPVRIHWNELGHYQRFELDPGVELEKAEGKPFTQSDLAKLHRVLAERDSNLWNIRMDQFLQKPGEGVDAVSSPTIIMDKRRYVVGAVWTCCTLWHWANGEVCAVIRNKTAAATNFGQLREHMQSGDHDYQVFALEQVTARQAYDPATLAVVLKRATTQDHAILKLVMDYVDAAPPAVYHTAIEQLLTSGTPKLRLMCLNSLLQGPHKPPREFHARLGTRLLVSDSYQEIDMFLKIIERAGPLPPAIATQVTSLLDHQNFLIARRAYWTLANQALPKSAKDRLKSFAKQHADRL